MKTVYPVILTPEAKGYSVYIPDFDANTQGDSLAEAIGMARDAIGMMGVDYYYDKKSIPSPHHMTYPVKKGELLTLVDIDFDQYRKAYENRAVKKNCTIPWLLCKEAEQANINFSQVLQEALREKLLIAKR